VNQILTDLGQLVRVHPSMHHNQFVVHPLEGDIAVRMNGTDVIQVLLNLIVNGFQCAPQPHLVEIQGKVMPHPLDLTAFKDGPQSRLLNVENFENAAPILMLSVRAASLRIHPEILPQIFQPYFTTKSAWQGTGLGLNIVQRLVKEARGVLHVNTKLGAGTTFSVYIPAVAVSSQ